MEILIALVVSLLAGFAVHWVVSGRVSHAARKLKKNGKLILFVSQGGTCRDPMATVIAEAALKEKMPDQQNIKFMGCGIGPSAANEASFAAQHVIHEIYGKELLKSYKPNVVTQDLIRAADLILVMDRRQLNNKVFPENKTFLLKTFFGLKGDVKDPYPDGRDEKTISRYRECAKELKSIIEGRFEYLRNFIMPTGAVT